MARTRGSSVSYKMCPTVCPTTTGVLQNVLEKMRWNTLYSKRLVHNHEYQGYIKLMKYQFLYQFISISIFVHFISICSSINLKLMKNKFRQKMHATKLFNSLHRFSNKQLDNMIKKLNNGRLLISLNG